MATGDTDLVTCTLKTVLTAKLNKITDLSGPNDPLSLTLLMKLSDGTGAEAGDQMWHDQRTLGLGDSDLLDLYGVLTNVYGDTANFAAIRAIILVNRLLNASKLEYGGAASNAWYPMFKHASDIGVVPLPGSTYPAWVLLTAPDANGFPVGASSSDIFKIAHGGEGSADITYDIILIGEQA